MKKSATLLQFLVIGALVTPPCAGAEELNIAGGDSLARVIALQKGKTVTVQLGSGQELTGQVKNVTEELAQLTGLAGKEFFDAVIPIDEIAAVMVRTK